MWTISKKILLGYVACMALLIIVGIAAVIVLSEMLDALRLRNGQREMLTHLHRVLTGLQDAETGQRGYLLTGKPEFLDPYQQAGAGLIVSLNKLQTMERGPQWKIEIGELNQLALSKLDHMDMTLEVGKSRSLAEAGKVVGLGEGKRIMDAIRQKMKIIDDRESAALLKLIEKTERNALLLKGLILTGLPLAIGICLVAGMILANHIARPIARITREAHRIEQGDLSFHLPVLNRQDEVGQLARSFEHMRAALEENRDQLITRNESLSALNDRLEEMTRAKSEFLAMMSHEIRTPLNALMGYSNLLSETALDDAQRQYVSTILASGKSLLTVINDVLDFSKIEAGKLTIEKEVFSIGRCLRETCELYRIAAADNGDTLTCTVGADVPAFAVGDAMRLRQVLSNLISNAVKFTRSGTIHVEASVAPAGDALRLLVSVRDTGIGIPPEKRGHLFKTFDQLGDSTARKYGGSGLGLAISKRLCELMDGSIRVDDTVTAGSTFHFEILLERASEADLATEGGLAAVTFAALDDKFLRQCRVVVAEDNPVNASLLSVYLKKHGILPVVVGDGRAAVTAADSADLMFMDVQMPLMDGLEAARAIRSRLGDPQRPYIIALTAEAMKGDAERGREAGMNDYLTKPFKPAELDHALAKYCMSRPPVPA